MYHPSDPLSIGVPRWDYIGFYNAWSCGVHCWLYRYCRPIANRQFRRWLSKEW